MVAALLTCSLFLLSCDGVEQAGKTTVSTIDTLLSIFDGKTASSTAEIPPRSATQHFDMPAFQINSAAAEQSKLLARLDQVVASDRRLAKQKKVAIVDYSQPISEPRFYLYDLELREVIYTTHVGHSPYSGYDIPDDFSNVPNTRKTSLGLYKVGREYRGQFGRSKRLHGLSKTNSNAYRRAIVMHSMPDGHPENLYSWGCLTFFEQDLSETFELLKRGTYVMVIS